MQTKDFSYEFKRNVVLVPVVITYKKGKKDYKFQTQWSKVTEKGKSCDAENYVIRTGQDFGLTVIDLDKDKSHNKDGQTWWEENFYPVEKHAGTLVKSPSGGYHLYFKYDGRLKSKANIINGVAVDCRNDKAVITAGKGYNVIYEVNLDQLPNVPDTLLDYMDKESLIVKNPKDRRLLRAEISNKTVKNLSNNVNEKLSRLLKYPNIETFMAREVTKEGYTYINVTTESGICSVKTNHHHTSPWHSVISISKGQQRNKETAGKLRLLCFSHGSMDLNDHVLANDLRTVFNPDAKLILKENACKDEETNQNEDIKGLTQVMDTLERVIDVEGFRTDTRNVYGRKEGTEFTYECVGTVQDFLSEFVKRKEVYKIFKTAPKNIYTNLEIMFTKGIVPRYSKDRRYFEFKNGVIDLGTRRSPPRICTKEEMRKNKVIAYNYFPLEFDETDVSTPNLDMILNLQYGDNEKAKNDLIMLLFGRTLYANGFDKWQVVPVIYGQSQCGKSVMTDVLTHILDNNVRTITEKNMTDFSMSYIQDFPLAIAKDCAKDFLMKFGLEEFKLIGEGGIHTGAKKHRDESSFKLETNLVVLSNYELQYDEVHGEISRRLAVTKFTKTPDIPDYDLKDNIIESEVVKIIWKAVNLYHAALAATRGASLDGYLESSFMANKLVLRERNNEILDYLKNDAGTSQYVISGDDKDHVLWRNLIASVKGSSRARLAWNEGLMKTYGLKKENVKACRLCEKLAGQEEVSECCTRQNRTMITVIYGLREL